MKLNGNSEVIINMEILFRVMQKKQFHCFQNQQNREMPMVNIILPHVIFTVGESRRMNLPQKRCSDALFKKGIPVQRNCLKRFQQRKQHLRLNNNPQEKGLWKADVFPRGLRQIQSSSSCSVLDKAIVSCYIIRYLRFPCGLIGEP